MTAARNPALEFVSLPVTQQLLLEGGDERIALGPEGANKYGCPPLPDPSLIALGSSTASGISASGFAAADRLRERLLQQLHRFPAEDIYAQELERIRHELSSLCELPLGTEIIISTSGTDAHFVTVQLASAGGELPTLAIMVEAAESGSSVPAALTGRGIELAKVRIRLADGTPRPAAEVDAEFERLAHHAASCGQRILLVLSDVSKTGLIAPSPACAMKLGQDLGQRMEVLVDACQFRISPPTLRAYLQQGFMVALTGSKFVAGPPFSGALFIPALTANRWRNVALPASLAACSLRAEWPEGWENNELPAHANFGLLLRWEAALCELRVFHALPEFAVKSFLQNFSVAVREYIVHCPALDLLPVPALDRASLASQESWDSIQTIFPFLLLHPETRLPLDMASVRNIHHLLQLDLSRKDEFSLGNTAALRCLLGQAVACGHPGAGQTGALRLCASARLAAAARAQGEAAIIQSALAALEKAALLTRHPHA